MDIQFNKDEIQEAIINRAVDELFDKVSTTEIVRAELRSKISEQISRDIEKKVDILLGQAMDDALSEDITPVNTWGEPVGKPTTLKAVIHERARDFWNTKVNGKGEATTYSGKPRWEHLLGERVQKEFSDLIKQDMTNIAGALKDAVRKDMHEAVNIGLNNLFKVKSKDDQGRGK